MNNELTDERIDAVWQAITPQRDPSGQKFYRAFARAIAAEVSAPIPDSTSLSEHARTTDTPTQPQQLGTLSVFMGDDGKVHTDTEWEVLRWRLPVGEYNFYVDGIRLAGGKESGK